LKKKARQERKTELSDIPSNRGKKEKLGFGGKRLMERNLVKRGMERKRKNIIVTAPYSQRRAKGVRKKRLY